MSLFNIINAQAEHGFVTINEDGTLSYRVPPQFGGSDTITCTFEAKLVVRAVADQAPETGADAARVTARETIAIPVLGNDVDPEGAVLTILAARADQGSVVIGADGTLLYTAPDEAGAATITYTISDPAGNMSEGTVAVEVTPYVPDNAAPVAAPDAAEVRGGDRVTIAVLGNDVDPEGGTLTITGATADQGTVTVDPDGTLSFAAPADFSGTAIITYTVADPAGSESQGTVTVEVTSNEQPVVGPDAATVISGGSVQIDVLGNDLDPEGGALTITGATADQGDVTVNSDGTLAYIAPAGFSGTTTITYTAADPAGRKSEGTVSVEVVTLAVYEGDTKGEFVVSSTPGMLAITVTEPAEDAGDYVLKTSDLAAGALNLAPPRIAGTAAVGATLSALPGLWAFDEAKGPLVVLRQWLRDAAPIAGVTGDSYTVDTADAGRKLSVLETADGARTATSVGLEIPAAPTPSKGWTPASLPGLALWLDASDAATVTVSGGEVARLADKSGNARHALKVTGVPAPTLGGTLAGKPTLRFPSGAILRSTGAALPGLPGMPGVTLIAVTQAHVTDSFKECVTIRNSLGTAGQYISLQTGYSMMWFGNGNRYWTTSPSGAVVEVARYFANGTHTATEMWRNGTKLAPTSTGKGTSSVSLPADAFVEFGNSDSLTSEQSEHLLVIGTLNDSDRQKIEGYLAHKWGLVGQLPAAHPYKTTPPA